MDAVFSKYTDAAMVGELLGQKELTLALAESCTGGLVSACITGVPGSSLYYKGGVVSYDNGVKEKVLGVSAQDLQLSGAVSREVARGMALGVRGLLEADIGLSVTGIAGPGGGTEDKPVGLVFIGLCTREVVAEYELRLAGSRDEIRQATVSEVLGILRAYLTCTEC
jgi:nicotinamide-nucleotide amidase